LDSGFIPVNSLILDGNEKQYVTQCIDSGWISSEGPMVARFEAAMAKRIGRKHAIAVSSGTAALDIAVKSLGIGPGDEVILPAFTIISCPAAIVRAGAVPVTVDCDPATWNMRPEDVAAKITPSSKAIMAVHIYGLPVDMDPIIKIAEDHGLFIIEDAAEMLGQTYKDKPCGAFGHISTLSFYPNKIVTTGEGGMVLTDDDAVSETCRSLRNLCFQKKRFVHEELGWNYRMSNIQAALGVAQLERIDDAIKKKRWIGNLYNDLLSGCPGIQLPVKHTGYAQNIYWAYGIVLKDTIDVNAEQVIARLEKEKIGARPFFWPVHRQPVFRKMGLFENECHPVAEQISERGFYIPSGLGLSEKDIYRVAGALKEVIQ
jgi:perosamine synthetase